MRVMSKSVVATLSMETVVAEVSSSCFCKSWVNVCTVELISSAVAESSWAVEDNSSSEVDIWSIRPKVLATIF